jgi:hypothetical protein
MSPRTGGYTRHSRRALSAQTWNRAAEAYLDESARLSTDMEFATSALSTIRHRARHMANDSARVRALGLELLPDGVYLASGIRALRSALNSPGSQRRRLAAARAQLDDVHAMLQTTVEITATIDIPGELGVSFHFISTLQTSARDGIASVSRLRGTLDYVESGGDNQQPAQVGDVRPSRSAQWLVHTLSQLLPTGSRERYFEEFCSELREYAETRRGSYAQIVHALGLASRIWALRNALSGTTLPPVGSVERVRMLARTDRAVAGRPQASLWEPVRRRFARWNAHYAARVVLRRQAREQRRQDYASQYDRSHGWHGDVVGYGRHRRSDPLRAFTHRIRRGRAAGCTESPSNETEEEQPALEPQQHDAGSIG